MTPSVQNPDTTDLSEARAKALASSALPAKDSASSGIASTVSSARRCQEEWDRRSFSERLGVLRRFRQAVAADGGTSLARLAADARDRPVAEVLSSEVLPVLDAARYLERRAAALLADRLFGIFDRPLWLAGTRTRQQREPLGVILVIGPSNYPLLLPGVQILQAITAGNAVLVKPAPGTTQVIRAFVDALGAAGLPDDLIRVLPDDTAAVADAIGAGVDKVVLTGSADTGRAILRLCAETLTPAVMELSGCDALFARGDADPSRVAAAVRFGLSLNAGRTCIAPRRIFANREIATALEEELQASNSQAEAIALNANEDLANALRGAVDAGARAVSGSVNLKTGTIEAPLVLADVPDDSPMLHEDFFAPVAALIAVEDDADALARNAACPYALGASIFGHDLEAARRLAGKVDAGCVTLNDLIAPTADPRLTFGGRRRSGFGSTRGAEGLLEMTAVKAVTETKAGGARPHYDPLTTDHDSLFTSYIKLNHGKERRLTALRALVDTLKKISRRGKNSPS